MISKITKLSIITINYNNKTGLEKTIKSVIDQTYTDFEYIVIDGNSTDRSQQIIEKFKYKISYAISETDTGVYNAMNKGIRVAHGEYLLFLNSGETLYNNKTLSEAIVCLNSRFDIFYGNAVFINKNKTIEKKYPNFLSFNFFYKDSLCHQSCFIKKSLFDNIFYYNESLKIVSDWEFFAYCICIKNVSCKYIDIIICNYFLDGLSSINRSLSLEEKEFVINKYFSRFVDDYKLLKIYDNEFNVKKIKQIFYLKQYNIAWKILKAVINFILLLLPKQKK